MLVLSAGGSGWLCEQLRLELLRRERGEASPEFIDEPWPDQEQATSAYRELRLAVLEIETRIATEADVLLAVELDAAAGFLHSIAVSLKQQRILMLSKPN